MCRRRGAADARLQAAGSHRVPVPQVLQAGPIYQVPHRPPKLPLPPASCCRQRVEGAAAPVALQAAVRQLPVAAPLVPGARDMGGATAAPRPQPPAARSSRCLSQVYLFFDNIELFLIFAGDQLSKLKVSCGAQPISRHFSTASHHMTARRPPLTGTLQRSSPLSLVLDRGFVVKARCMLWAAHCVAVAALSTMEIRAKETAQRRQQQHGAHRCALNDTLSHQQQPPPLPPASLPNVDSGNVISISQLKRQLLAHVMDFPLAARSAGIQVVARASHVAVAGSRCPSSALRFLAR